MNSPLQNLQKLLGQGRDPIERRMPKCVYLAAQMRVATVVTKLTLEYPSLEVSVAFRADVPAQVQMPVGCLECRMTGYYGRVGLYEIMTLTPTLRRLIHAESEDSKIREQAYREGMKPLRVSGASKIAAGLSTLDEVVKVAPLA